MHSQDTFVGCVAIGLGLAALVAAFRSEKLAQWSGIAKSIHSRWGANALVVATLAIGFFLIGVGISLLK